MNEIKDKLLNLDIVDVIGKHMTLKKAGANYKGCCPLPGHQEKTPSFTVSPGKNIWKCFGCGKGGNVIDFIIEKKGLEFVDAMKDLCQEHHIEWQKKEYSEEDRAKDLHRESLYIVNKIAAGYFEENLYKPENALALEYVKSRWSDETIRLFSIGFASDSWNELLNYFNSAAVKTEIAIEAGLIKESDKKKLFDFFRNRIIFPIKDKMGRVVGFSGRILPETNNDPKHMNTPETTVLPGIKNNPKYLNTPETAVFKKGEVLYGLNSALKSIRDKQMAWLVEGNPDVVKLQGIGIDNTVGPCGTSLTADQIKLLKPLVKSINIIGDSDSAGQKAVKRNAELIINEGIAVGVVEFPSEENSDKKQKHDPDSFFTSEDQFKGYVSDKTKDYIILRAQQLASKAHNPDFKAKAVEELSILVCKFADPSMHEIYADNLGKIISPKKAWTDKIKALLKEKDPVEKREIIPQHVNMNDFERYGFYADQDGYHFRTKSGIQRGCNFVMKPLFHIQSVISAKRLYQIKNEFGHTETIELLQKDLVSLPGFKVRIESLGNFLWMGTEQDLNKLKMYLYEKTETCIEITQMGWQKCGFFAWGNGIYNEKFSKVDENGIVRHGGKNYYLPAFSSIYKGEDGLFVTERRFIHRDTNHISLYDYSHRLLDVFGDNAMIAMCFYFATLFRDFLVQIFNFFPILNLFGPKGAGKTELAVSMLHFFGKGGKGPNINNTTKAALADHVSQVANGCVHIDEYKNTIDFEKIEFLKGLWDGTGRTRMNMDKDKKKETTAVDCGVILSGQEMPTADIALFSRLIYLSFYKNEYNSEEKKNFTELKDLESKGLTHITHELLSLRDQFKANYLVTYDRISEEIGEALGNDIIEDRLFRGWVMIVSAYFTIEDKISVAFSHGSLIKAAVSQMKIQQRETRTSNEISTFWNLVQFMHADGLIQEGVDFKIDFAQRSLKTDMIDAKFPEPKHVLFIQHSRIIPLYRKIGKQNNEKILPADSIDYYLKHDKRYLGKKQSCRFVNIDPKTGIPVAGKSKVTTAYCFDYKLLEIVLHNEDDVENKDEDDFPY